MQRMDADPWEVRDGLYYADINFEERVLTVGGRFTTERLFAQAVADAMEADDGSHIAWGPIEEHEGNPDNAHHTVMRAAASGSTPTLSG